MCPLISSTDLAKIIKPSLYFAKSVLTKHKIVVENQYSGELQDAQCCKLQSKINILVCCKSPSAVNYDIKSIFWCAASR